MIPATSITFNDDPAGEPASTGTAWLVFKFGTGLNGEAWEELDRPCDECGGTGLQAPHWANPQGACRPCHGSGRHTFTIEVATPEAKGFGEFIDSYRVSVVPGMVLAILHASHADGIHGPHICIQPGATFTLHTSDGWQRITLPSDAKPGGWAAQLVVGA